MVQLPDALAISLVVGAAAAFVLGEMALADAEDLRAIYWLAVGAICVTAAVQMGRSGAKT
jgi:hypothetical protein